MPLALSGKITYNAFICPIEQPLASSDLQETCLWRVLSKSIGAILWLCKKPMQPACGKPRQGCFSKSFLPETR
jgi:hypothetical protein